MSVATRASSFFAATVPCRRSRIGELVYVRLSCVGFTINLSSFYSSASKSSSIHKNAKIKGTMERSSQTGKTTKKESSMESHVSIDLIRSDPSKLEVMTVEELRKLTRSVGIPARGRKKDLVSSLRAFSMKMENVSQDRQSQIMTSGNAKLSAKRKFEPSTSGDDPEYLASVPEVSHSTEKRIRRRKQLVENTSVRDAKQSSVSKKASSNVKSNILGIDDTCLSVNASEPWTVLAHKKPQDGWVPYNPRTMRPLPLTRDTMLMKVVSWNVNGLRALLKLESFSTLAQKEDFDVLCLQETKLQEKDVEDIRERLIEGYNHGFWRCSVSKLGYSGTAIVSRIKPISVRYGLGLPDHDSEGRLVTVEFERYYLITGYVPNSGDGLRRLEYRIKEWDPALSNYVKYEVICIKETSPALPVISELPGGTCGINRDLEKSKPVILTGDLNCAHEEIDIYNPAGNRRNAGFTDEERMSFEVNFLSRGFVDTFRKQHPGVVGYTYWGYRHGGRKTNKGWRLDYFLVSESIADKVHDSYILPEVMGSDHCPIGLILKH